MDTIFYQIKVARKTISKTGNVRTVNRHVSYHRTHASATDQLLHLKRACGEQATLSGEDSDTLTWRRPRDGSWTYTIIYQMFTGN